MEIGKGTNLSFSLELFISIIASVVMACGLWYGKPSTEYVDNKIKEECTARIVTLEEKQETEKERNQKLDTAIQLLSQSVENHDKNMEAFTRALEQLRED